ncbi:MAG TPA: PaaI family thioesterase [Solirubrobacteraceae bacterium]
MEANAIHAHDGVTEFMGFRWVSAEEVRLTIRPDLMNQGGMLSGVVSYALIDYGMGAALFPHITAEEGFATISIGITYVATAREGEIVCGTRLDRRTRGSAALRSEVTHADGRLLATAVGAYSIFPRRRR